MIKNTYLHKANDMSFWVPSAQSAYRFDFLKEQIAKVEQKHHFNQAAKSLAKRNYDVAQKALHHVSLDSLYGQWLKECKNSAPFLTPSYTVFVRSLAALLSYFQTAQHAKQNLLLPSHGADLVWHAWIECDSGGLDALCKKFFHRVFQHQQNAELVSGGTNLDEAVSRTYIIACQIEKIEPLTGEFPLLFQFDHKYDIPGGYHYTVTKRTDEIYLARTCPSTGRTTSQERFAPLSGQILYDSGLINGMQYKTYTENVKGNKKSSDSKGGGCGGGGGSCGSGKSSEGASDSGGDSGGGCGGGCG